LPVGLGVVLVAVVLPCVDFVGRDFLVGDAAIQKLPSFSMTGATSRKGRWGSRSAEDLTFNAGSQFPAGWPTLARRDCLGRGDRCGRRQQRWPARGSRHDYVPSEAETFWTAFLRKLARRGLRSVKLAVSDAHEGICGRKYTCGLVQNDFCVQRSAPGLWTRVP
jgi:Transposase, Mutator family